MNKPNKYKWLKERSYIFRWISIDLLLFSTCYLFTIDSIINFHLINFTLLFFYLININYIFGKYHNFEVRKYMELSNYIFYDFFIIILNLVFLNLCKLFFPNNFNQIDNKYFLISLFLIILFNTIFKLINFVRKNNRLNEKKWIFIGNFATYKKILKENKLKKTNYKIVFSEPSELAYKNNNFEGIIYEFNSKKKLDQNNKLFAKKLILNVDDWFENYHQRIPTSIVISKENYQINRDLYNYNMQIRIKRLFDILISFLLLILTSILLVICFILIYLQDLKSPFYKQVRNGMNFKLINIYKLRTMKHNAEKKGVQWSYKNDSRVTFIGKYLRKTRIDELPQLFSVIKGDMSLIGPRPERPEIDERLNKEIYQYHLRYSVKPGLSGWAQVNYPYGASIRDSEVKLSYDIFYIKNFSILLDLLIFFKTLKLIFNAKGSVPY